MKSTSFLESGTNELKILEYSCMDVHFGINILKVSRVIPVPDQITRIVNAHSSIVGIMDDHGVTITVIDLGHFLGLKEKTFQRNEPLKGRILVTEFFGQINGFLIDQVHYVHTILWEQVFDSNDILRNLGSHYVIGIVRPDKITNVLLMDYETIILELSPDVKAHELEKAVNYDEDGNNSKILFAEDSTTVRNMLTLELEEMGFQVLAAKDGQLALDLFEEHDDIALVITDVEMPQLEGLSLTKKIKEARPNLPVIIYSSIGDIGMKDRAKQVHADAHVTKLDIEELMEVSHRLLNAAEK